MGAALFHGCLYLVGGASQGYQATFRVVSYSTVPIVFNIVPVLGSLASLWSLVLIAVGLRETHKTSTGKAAAAVLIPIGVAALFVIAAALMGAVIGLSAVKHAVSEEVPAGKLPAQVCSAVESYIGKVDAAASLDSQSAQQEVQAAIQDLTKELDALGADARVGVVMQKAMVFGLGTIALSELQAQFTGNLDEMREDLRKMCR